MLVDEIMTVIYAQPVTLPLENILYLLATSHVFNT